MKKLFSILGIAALVFSACQKEGGKGFSAPELTSNSTSVNAYAAAADPVVTFSWTSAGNDVKYSLQLSKEGDAEFASGTAVAVNGTTVSFSGAELADVVAQLGSEKSISMIARVRATATGKEAVISNVVTVAVRILDVDPSIVVSELYPIGEATPYGWSYDNSVPCENNDGVFTWTGHLFANAEFKFLCQRDWWPGIVNSSEDPYEYKPVYAASDANGADKKFKVAEEGKYTVTINAKDINAITMKVEFIDADVQTFVVNELYILGAATQNGWNLDGMEAFTANGKVFTWTGYLFAGQEFRFPLQKQSNVWWPCLMFTADGKSVVLGKSDAEKVVYTVAEDGNYTITIDATNTNDIKGTIVSAD